MNYYRGMAFIALIHTALAHTMDQTPSALTLPKEMWEKVNVTRPKGRGFSGALLRLLTDCECIL